MNEWFDQAKKKLEAEVKRGSYDKYGDAMKTAVKDALTGFCRQDEELAQAREKITELESRPVNVAVQEPDPAEIRKQIDDAVKVAKAAADKKQKELKEQIASLAAREKELTAEVERRKKEATEAEKRAVEQQAGIASIEKERLEREVGELKKQLAMSDAAVASFRVLFDQAQDILGRTIEAVGKVADAETADKLRAAVRKLLEAYGEKVG